MSGRKKRVWLPAPPETARFFDKLRLDDPRSDPELDKARKSMDRVMQIEGGFARPPWMEGPNATDGPRVRAVKACLKICFPQDEWRAMKLKAVTLKINDELERRGERPVSPDSVARAMGRRNRR